VLFLIDRFLCKDLPGYGTQSRVVISVLFTWGQSKLLFWALCWVLKLSGGRSRVRGLSLWQYLEDDRQSGRAERNKCRYRGNGTRSDFVEWHRTILEPWKESTISKALSFIWRNLKTCMELEVSSRKWRRVVSYKCTKRSEKPTTQSTLKMEKAVSPETSVNLHHPALCRFS